MTFGVAPGLATVLWSRNLSLHTKSAGASFCACIVTADDKKVKINDQHKDQCLYRQYNEKKKKAKFLSKKMEINNPTRTSLWFINMMMERNRGNFLFKCHYW